MRIIQIIDSLEAGGAEMMAVNYANLLAEKIAFSGIVATRKEGNLKLLIDKKVPYLFLNKNGTADFKAVFKLRAFCKQHKIQIVHAHGTSFFIAFCLKMIFPRISIVWHDHYGLSEFLSTRKSIPLKITSLFFKGIISVNKLLQEWAKKTLFCNEVIYLPNFSSPKKVTVRQTVLRGTDGKKILCLANLRPQKNHFLLLEVAKKTVEQFPEWSFHIVGKDFGDDYSKAIREMVVTDNLDRNVYFYDSVNDTDYVIEQADIALLTSDSEGLPVSLLEYGLYKKPVVVTNVGEISSVITDGFNGMLVPSNDAKLFTEVLIDLIKNTSLRKNLGESLYETIKLSHSGDAIVGHYLEWLKK